MAAVSGWSGGKGYLRGANRQPELRPKCGQITCPAANKCDKMAHLGVGRASPQGSHQQATYKPLTSLRVASSLRGRASVPKWHTLRSVVPPEAPAAANREQPETRPWATGNKLAPFRAPHSQRFPLRGPLNTPNSSAPASARGLNRRLCGRRSWGRSRAGWEDHCGRTRRIRRRERRR